MRTSFLAALPVFAALGWAVAVIAAPDPLESVPALLFGIGTLAMATVAMIGIVVVGGRWAHRLALASLAFMLALAVVRPIDGFWVVATALTVIALIAVLSPPVVSGIRKLPSASGPPPRAVLPPLLLISVPAALGLTGNTAPDWALLTVGLSALLAALMFSRVLPGGLITVRIVWPVLAIALAPVLGLPSGLVAAAYAAAVAALAWHPSVKASYHPPREVGSTFPIPPELAPTEVLDAAQIDDKGKRR